MSLIVKVWLKSLAYPSREEGGKFHVQMISTCLRYTQRRGGGDPRPVPETMRKRRKGKGRKGAFPVKRVQHSWVALSDINKIFNKYSIKKILPIKYLSHALLCALVYKTLFFPRSQFLDVSRK